MSPDEFDSALSDLETRVDRLRALYENWFRGYEKSEPSVARKEVERRVYQLRKELPRNTALRFRYHQLYQRYTTLATYWQRTARQIEEGTYKLQLTRLKRRNEGRPQRRERKEGKEGDEEKERPQSFELNLDESLSVDDLLDASELDEVARALDAPGPHQGPASARVPEGALRPAQPAAAASVAQSFARPGGTGTMGLPKPGLADAGAVAKGPAPFGGMPSTGKLPAPAQPAKPAVLGAAHAGAVREPGPQAAAAADGAAQAPLSSAAVVPARPAAGAARPAPPGAPVAGQGARPAPPAATRPSPAREPEGAPRPQPVATAPQGGTLAGLGKPMPQRPHVPPPPPARTGEPSAGAPARPAPPPVPAAPVLARPAVPVAPPREAPQVAPRRPASPAPGVRPGAPIAPSNTIVGRPPVASPIAGGGLNEQRMKRIYDEYAAARRRNNEGEVRYEALVGSIQKMLPELSKKHQGKQIDFDVVVKDGRVGLKPKAT